jgi:hypothetical protein
MREGGREKEQNGTVRKKERGGGGRERERERESERVDAIFMHYACLGKLCYLYRRTNQERKRKTSGIAPNKRSFALREKTEKRTSRAKVGGKEAKEANGKST